MPFEKNFRGVFFRFYKFFQKFSKKVFPFDLKYGIIKRVLQEGIWERRRLMKI